MANPSSYAYSLYLGPNQCTSCSDTERKNVLIAHEHGGDKHPIHLSCMLDNIEHGRLKTCPTCSGSIRTTEIMNLAKVYLPTSSGEQKPLYGTFQDEMLEREVSLMRQRAVRISLSVATGYLFASPTAMAAGWRVTNFLLNANLGLSQWLVALIGTASGVGGGLIVGVPTALLTTYLVNRCYACHRFS